MAAAPIKNEAIKNGSKNNRRRRKKRRTEDFSSDESSSSSDSSDDESSKVEKPEDVVAPVEEDMMDIDNIDIGSDNEAEGIIQTNEQELLSDSTKKELSKIKLTSTSLTTNPKAPLNVAQVTEQLDKDRAQLNNEYLKLLARTYDNDLDELRKAPDFSQKSLVLLAKSLQSGGNIFDEDTLSAIVGTN